MCACFSVCFFHIAIGLEYLNKSPLNREGHSGSTPFVSLSRESVYPPLSLLSGDLLSGGRSEGAARSPHTRVR